MTDSTSGVIDPEVVNFLADLPTLDETDEFLNILYFGEPGSGKTTSAMHMAMEGRIVVVNAEAGIKKKPLRALDVPTDRIHPFTVKNYDDLDRLYWQVAGQLDEQPGSIAGVVFDSMTEIQKLLIESIVGIRHAKAVKMARNAGTSVKDDEFWVDRDEYQRMTEMVRRVSRRFRDLPCHTAFVCLERKDTDNDGVYYRPALTPAFANDLMGYVDIAVYTVVGEGEPEDRSRFTGVTRPTGKYRGKDRYNATPPLMANPTFDRVWEYVRTEDEDFAIKDPYQIARGKRLAAAAG